MSQIPFLEWTTIAVAGSILVVSSLTSHLDLWSLQVVLIVVIIVVYFVLRRWCSKPSRVSSQPSRISTAKTVSTVSRYCNYYCVCLVVCEINYDFSGCKHGPRSHRSLRSKWTFPCRRAPLSFSCYVQSGYSFSVWISNTNKNKIIKIYLLDPAEVARARVLGDVSE